MPLTKRLQILNMFTDLCAFSTGLVALAFNFVSGPDPFGICTVGIVASLITLVLLLWPLRVNGWRPGWFRLGMAVIPALLLGNMVWRLA